MDKSLKQLQVILVDDNPRVRNSIKSLLSLDETIIISGEADSSDEALQLLTSIKPDVMLVDISFNGRLSGIELIKKVRELYFDIKIIVLSMHDNEDLVRKALESGADFFISKEHAPEKIIELLKSKKETQL